ncbi:hypothetical protein CTAYLR_008062 [Chrysophaeum taylorii]|uniref:Uncharacterized protein n=1 Tax=Chrysophaeum taylorii TaxID=2483200 RepID=A0AAD7UKA7_9STRA|nr:hypothetical protein CTAYLR_008062 [Chrysophaeum taylorii]
MVKSTLRDVKQKDGTFIIPADTTQLSLADHSMGGSGMGVPGARRLAFALKEGWMVNRGEDGTPIVSIDISGNKIGPDGATKLFGALPGGRAGSLTELDASGNDIGPEGGIKALNTALRAEGCGSSLVKLSLGRNGLGDEGALLLANTLKQGALPKLQRLFLTRNGIGNEGAELLAAAFKSAPLVAVHLNANHIGDKGAIEIANALKALDVPPTLKSLLLTDNRIGDAGAVAIGTALAKPTSAASNLAELGLGKNLITSHGCASLAHALASPGAKAITSLSLDDNDAIPHSQLHNFHELLNLPFAKRAAAKNLQAEPIQIPAKYVPAIVAVAAVILFILAKLF